MTAAAARSRRVAPVAAWPADAVEEWRLIPGHPAYEASSMGRIRSVDRVLTDGRKWRGRIMRQRPNKYGYWVVALSMGATKAYRHAGVHVLVAEAFHGARPTPAHEVAHGDGEPANNREANLRWATPLENAADRDRHGRTFEPKGVLHPLAKLTDEAVLAMRAGRIEGASITLLASLNNVSLGAVYDVLSGRTWGHV